MRNGFLFTVIFIIILVLIGIVQYNTIASRDEMVTTAWTPLSSALDLRYTAVPSLARSIILYAGREDETTKDLLADQQNYMNAKTVLTKAAAANDIELDLDRIRVEATQLYPGIGSHYQFIQLIQTFEESQKKMEASLAFYNVAIEKYNSYIRKFPNNIIALICGFHRGSYVKKSGV